MSKFVITRMRHMRRLYRDRSGSSLLIFAAIIPALLGILGLSIDVGMGLIAKRQLDAATQAAALAGAYEMLSSNTQSSVQTAVTNWNKSNPVTNLTITSAAPTLSCNSSVTGLPACNGSTPNAVSLTQTASIQTHFLRAFGVNSFALSSTASAAMAGGTAQSLNIAFILDATASMNDAETACTVTNVTNPSKYQCALAGIQSVLQTAPTSLDQASVWAFPGTATSFNPTSTKCGTQPASEHYYTSGIIYQQGTGWTGGAWRTDYNSGNGSLNDSSPLVALIGDYANKKTPCLAANGGQGSYAAEIISKVAASFPTNGPTGTKNVIIMASDGGYDTTSADLSGQTGTNYTMQCQAAVNAATTATNNGVTIYSIAYDAVTSGGCASKDTLSSCQTMEGIASSTKTFYTTNSSCEINGSPNPVGDLPTVFKAITTNFTKPRLIN